MQTKTHAYWLDSTAQYQASESIKEDISCDFLIIGGGFSGLSSAFNLKSKAPEARIVLLESEFIGYGASGRNTGFCVSKFGLDLPTVKKMYGQQKTLEAHHFAERSIDYVKAMVSQNNMDSDYRHCGYVQVACSKARQQKLIDTLQLHKTLGIDGDIHLLDESQIQNNIHSDSFLSGLEYRNSALLNPLKHLREWKRLCLSIGVEIYENSAVTNIESAKNLLSKKVQVQTRFAHINTTKLIIATNAYMHLMQGLEKFKRQQNPLWAYAVATEPLSQQQWQALGWQNKQGLQDNCNLLHVIRPTADGRLIIAGNKPGLSFGNKMNLENNNKTWRTLEAQLKAYFPQLQSLAITHAWGGPVSTTVDMAPAIGFLGNENILYSTGCFGHGLASSQLYGCILTELALEQKTTLSDFWIIDRKPKSWPVEPISFLAKKAMVSLMAFEDKIKQA